MEVHGLYRTLQYCTVLCSTAQYCTVLYSAVQYCTVPHKTVQFCTELCSTVQYCTVQYCTILYSIVQYRTVQEELAQAIGGPMYSRAKDSSGSVPELNQPHVNDAQVVCTYRQVRRPHQPILETFNKDLGARNGIHPCRRWESLWSVRFQTCTPARTMKHCDPCRGAV